jgi:hypothetical protein
LTASACRPLRHHDLVTYRRPGGGGGDVRRSGPPSQRPENCPGAAAWWPAAGAAVVAFPLSVAGLIYLNGLILQAFGAWTARRWPAIAAAAMTAWRWPDTPLEMSPRRAPGSAAARGHCSGRRG